MVFFPHKIGRDPETLADFLDYSTQCVKKQDNLSALFYCYWAFEAIKKEREKVKKKDLDKVEEYAAAFLARAAELRKMYNAHPVASTMKGAELEMMQRRIQDLKAQFAEVEAKVPASDEEAGKLAEQLKNISEEGSFLDDLFSPIGHVEGPEVWQDRLAKGAEHLFTTLAQVRAQEEATLAEAKKKEEAKAAGGSKKEEAKAAKEAEARKKEEAKAAEAKKKEEAKAAKEAEAKKKEEDKKSKGDKKAEEAKKE